MLDDFNQLSSFHIFPDKFSFQTPIFFIFKYSKTFGAHQSNVWVLKILNPDFTTKFHLSVSTDSDFLFSIASNNLESNTASIPDLQL